MKKTTRIMCWNVNGLRSVISKGFWDWFDASGADIVCLQESKITAVDFEKIVHEFELHLLTPRADQLLLDDAPKSGKLFVALNAAERAGYSGVVILSKEKPLAIEQGIGVPEFDTEGRVLIAHYPKFSLVNVYVPNGGRELDRIPFKLEFSDALLKRLEKLRREQPNIIICGDMNVAHQEIDIRNPKTNVGNSGFTPEEREWFTKFLSKGYVDTFRHLNPDARDRYTWWSYRPGVREKNIGWRIDYFVTTKEILPMIKATEIHDQQRGSDHCPIELEIHF